MTDRANGTLVSELFEDLKTEFPLVASTRSAARRASSCVVCADEGNISGVWRGVWGGVFRGVV